MKLKMSCLFNLKTLLILIITINALICYSSTKKSSIKAFSKRTKHMFQNSKFFSDNRSILYVTSKSDIEFASSLFENKQNVVGFDTIYETDIKKIGEQKKNKQKLEKFYFILNVRNLKIVVKNDSNILEYIPGKTDILIKFKFKNKEKNILKLDVELKNTSYFSVVNSKTDINENLFNNKIKSSSINKKDFIKGVRNYIINSNEDIFKKYFEIYEEYFL